MIRLFDWSGQDKAGVRFEKETFAQGQVLMARLDDAVFDHCFFEEVDFSGSALAGASFRGCVFQGCRFSGAFAPRSDWIGSQLTSCHADNLNVTAARLDATQWRRANLDGAILTRATATGALWGECHFRQSNFEFARLDNTSWEFVAAGHATFGFARLDRARLQDSQFPDTDFSGASLEGLQAIRCHFERADFWWTGVVPAVAFLECRLLECRWPG